MLLTCPWSEQPPTEAPEEEEEEEEEEDRIEFDGDKVAEEVEEEEDVEVVEYEVVKEEEDLWTKSMDEWAERQRSCAPLRSTQTGRLHRVLILLTFFSTLK